MPDIVYKVEKDWYGLKLFIALSILLLILATSSFYLIENYFSKSFFSISKHKTIYFLQSDTLQDMYQSYQMDYDNYLQRIKRFEKIIKKQGYKVEEIFTDDIKNIPNTSIVIALDMTALNDQEINDIDQFVSNGGKLIFNYTSGFLDEDLKYRKDTLVKRITNFTIDPTVNFIKPDPKSGIFFTTRLASPFAKYLSRGKAVSLNIYDPFPVYIDHAKHEADAYLTNWSQTKYINITPTHELSKTQSSVLWHGNKQKGKWIYFSFASSSFLDSLNSNFEKLFEGMLEYFENIATVIPYPYIDTNHIVFVSEDTEYKFENLHNFAETSKKYKFPVTAFCVAKLAQEYQDIVYQAAQSPYMEIGSHSYSHTKIVGSNDEKYKKETIGSKEILEKITKKTVYGFRAPREEIDSKLIQDLIDGGYKYILNEGDNLLYPYFKEGILIIPRHGTDDYSYLIRLDWDSEEILTNMIKEMHITSALNGIYTLSTHTHLLNFGKNIKILDQFFDYINKHQELTPLNGKMLYDRIYQRNNLHITTNITEKKIILTLKNDIKTNIKDLHLIIETDTNIILKEVESEIVGLQTQLKKISNNKYILTVKELKPNSESVFFINYDQNN